MLALNLTLRSLLASELKRIGSPSCVDKALVLESSNCKLNAIHLRDLQLSPKNLPSILNSVKLADIQSQKSVKSISFSYNPSLGDSGAEVFSENLILAVREVGLVGYNIQDEGGYKILEWIKATPSLRLICIEQNQFSQQLQNEFRMLGEHRPELMIVF